MTDATNVQVRVLHVIPTLSSGGAERQLISLIQSTDPAVVRHTVCVIQSPQFLGHHVREAGHELIELGLTGTHPILRAARAVASLYSEVKPDLVHTWLYDASIAGRLGTLFTRDVPLITSLQFVDYEPEAIRTMGWSEAKVGVLKLVDRLTAMRNNQHFVACSDHVRNSYIQHFGIAPDRIDVIYNSVNASALLTTPAERCKLRTVLSIPTDACVYINVGRLDPQKDHARLIRAFAKVGREPSDPYLLIVGVGDLERELKDLARTLEVGDRVLFLGRRSDIGTLLNASDIFVFPSLFEGLGVALIEAMFAALPCVVSDLDVFREFLVDGKNALVVSNPSVEALTAAMDRLAADSQLRERLGAEAKATAEGLFSIDVTAQKWESLYIERSTSVLGQERPG